MKRSNGEQSEFSDPGQVTLKAQLQADHCLTIWLQIWYHSAAWGDSIRKGRGLEKLNRLFSVHPGIKEINFISCQVVLTKEGVLTVFELFLVELIKSV